MLIFAVTKLVNLVAYSDHNIDLETQDDLLGFFLNLCFLFKISSLFYILMFMHKLYYFLSDPPLVDQGLGTIDRIGPYFRKHL